MKRNIGPSQCMDMNLVGGKSREESGKASATSQRPITGSSRNNAHHTGATGNSARLFLTMGRIMPWLTQYVAQDHPSGPEFKRAAPHNGLERFRIIVSVNFTSQNVFGEKMTVMNSQEAWFPATVTVKRCLAKNSFPCPF